MPGDLDVNIFIKPHQKFVREGLDILSEEKVNLIQAILGDTIEVETLDKKVKLTIPAGTQPNTVFRLKGQGIPHVHGYAQGDMLVTVVVDVPTKLNSKQKVALAAFGKEMGFASSGKHKSLFDKIKKKI